MSVILTSLQQIVVFKSQSIGTFGNLVRYFTVPNEIILSESLQKIPLLLSEQRGVVDYLTSFHQIYSSKNWLVIYN